MKKILWISLVLILFLAGCGGSSDTPETATPTEAPLSMVTPYTTAAPLSTQAPTLTPTASPTPPPLPTATPFIHTVTEGQTMIGIASYYGVNLDALGVANPEVNPNYLSVGATLIIPLEESEDGEGVLPAASDPEILPVTGGAVACLPNRVGGMWCFWPVTNSTTEPVENLVGVIHLYDEAGEALRSKPAYSLLNLLNPGETIALGAYFKSPEPDWVTVQGQIASAAAANQADSRYLALTVSEFDVQQVDQGGLVNQVSGLVNIPGGGPAPGLDYLWVVAVAYDDAGQVAGLRRWEATEDVLADLSGETIEFDFEVYSLGRPISQVEIFVESRAAGE